MRSSSKVDQPEPRSQRWFEDDPLDLVDADLAGDVVVITLPEQEARALVKAAQWFNWRSAPLCERPFWMRD